MTRQSRRSDLSPVLAVPSRVGDAVPSSSAPPGHRFEDVPGVRRHLVRKSTKGQIVHTGKDHREPSTRSRKQDRTPHEVRRRRGGF